MSLLNVSSLGGGQTVGFLLKYAIAPIAAISTIFKSYDFVAAGERGLKFRFGREVRKFERRAGSRWRLKPRQHRTPKMIEPGFVFLIPFVDKLRKIDIRDRAHELEPILREYPKTGRSEWVRSAVTFKVICEPWSVYYAIVRPEHLDRMIVLRCEPLATRYIQDDSKPYSRIPGLVKRSMKPHAAFYGVQVMRFDVLTHNATDGTQAANAFAGRGITAVMPLPNGLNGGHKGLNGNGNGHHDQHGDGQELPSLLPVRPPA